MRRNHKKCTVAAAALSILAAGSANAALMDGYTDASNDTSVFISVVERNASNQALRNLVIDTGARTLATFAFTGWSTTAAQETQILAFLQSAGAGSSVLFNVGGGLNDQSFSTDRYGFLTTGNAVGPDIDDYTALGTGVTNIDTHILDVNSGTFNAANIVVANAATDAGWHEVAWGNSVGGAITPSNEVLFGQSAPLIGWRPDYEFQIVRTELGGMTSDAASGDITFNPVPLPGVAWLAVSAFAGVFGLRGVRRRRPAA